MGVLAERKGFTINWAKFAETVHRRKGSFSPLPEYKYSSSSPEGGEEEDEEEGDDEHKDKEEKKEENQEEKEEEVEGEEEDNTDHGGDVALGTDIPPINEQQVDEEVLVQPEPKLQGGPDEDQLQSPRGET